MEKRFEFNAQKTGMYRIVLKNLGAKLTLWMQNSTQVIQIKEIGPIPLNLTQSNTNYTAPLNPNTLPPNITSVEEVVDEEPVLIYVRLEAFQPPISAEFFSVNENLAADEQEYVNGMAKSLKGNIEPIWNNSLKWVIPSICVIIVVFVTIILVKAKRKRSNFT